MPFKNHEVVIQRGTVALRGEGKDSMVVTIPPGAIVTVTGYDGMLAKCGWAGWVVYLLKSVIDAGVPF